MEGLGDGDGMVVVSALIGAIMGCCRIELSQTLLSYAGV